MTEPRPPVEVLPTWLPDPERPGGDWIQYIEDLYAQYTADFLTNRTVWRAKPVFVDRDPQYNGKDVGFWHLISGIDRVTKDLLDPEPDRCARLCWVRPVLEAHPDDVRTWIQERNGFIAIALPDFSFRVILKERDRVVYLKSAYPWSVQAGAVSFEPSTTGPRNADAAPEGTASYLLPPLVDEGWSVPVWISCGQVAGSGG